jgi:hypothetical protein
MPSSTTEILSRVSLAISSEHNQAEQISVDLHPQEGADVSDLGGSSGQSWVIHGRRSRDDLGRVKLVGVDLARGKGVARESDGRSTCCGGGASSASGDGTRGRRSGEHA